VRHQFARLTDDGHDGEAPAWPPRYVERGGELATRQPFDARDVSLYVFVLRADRLLLELLCEQTFDRPSAGTMRYVPIGGSVMLVFANIGELQSTGPPDDRLGRCPEQELGVWVPVFDRWRGRASWTLPYTFVDEPTASAGGREIYGFPKQLAEVSVPAVDQDPTQFEVQAHCIDRFAPNARVQKHRVVRARRPGAGPLARDWPGLRSALVDLLGAGAAVGAGLGRLQADLVARRAGVAVELEPALLFLCQLALGRVPVVLLKQFRDAADPRFACYQAIIEAPQTLLAYRGGGLLSNDWEVEVADLDGEPLVRELGVKAGPNDPGLAFWLDIDFRIERGRALWEARP
jgi:Acetoacetate decarboxylase (ADC)